MHCTSRAKTTHLHFKSIVTEVLHESSKKGTYIFQHALRHNCVNPFENAAIRGIPALLLHHALYCIAPPILWRKRQIHSEFRRRIVA